MKHLILIAAVAFGLTSSLVAEEPAAYKPEVGDFEAKFPGKPSYAKQEQKSAAGNIDMHMHILEANGGKVAYMIMHNNYPFPINDAATKKRVLQGGQAGAIANTRGQLKSSKEITIGEHPGVEFVFTAKSGNDEFTGYWCLYIVGQTLYQVAIVDGVGVAEADRKAFMDSFKLTE